MNYSDPVTGKTFSFELISRDNLWIGKYQREYSSTLVNKLVNSIAKGFIVPIICTEDGEVIDGQHRLGGLDKTLSGQDFLVPCIIVPAEFRNYPLFYNIEKTDNIKDKCFKLQKLYLDKMKDDVTEDDIAPSANYESYLVTLAFSFTEMGLKSPSLVESPVKKLEKGFLWTKNEEGYRTSLLLKEAVETRRNRASLVASFERAVEEIAAENGITDFNLKKAIVSQASQTLWGRKRSVDEEIEEGIVALQEQMEMMDWSWMGKR